MLLYVQMLDDGVSMFLYDQMLCDSVCNQMLDNGVSVFLCDQMLHYSVCFSVIRCWMIEGTLRLISFTP